MLPLRLAYSEAAEGELAKAYAWLQTFGVEVAERWLAGLAETLEREAALLAAVSLRRPRAPDSPEGRDLFVLLYRTRGGRGSAWHLVYEVSDADGDGSADTLVVLRVRHAARGEE